MKTSKKTEANHASIPEILQNHNLIVPLVELDDDNLSHISAGFSCSNTGAMPYPLLCPSIERN